MLWEVLLAKCTSILIVANIAMWGVKRNKANDKEKSPEVFSIEQKKAIFKQKRKGKASTFCMYIYTAICELTIHN